MVKKTKGLLIALAVLALLAASFYIGTIYSPYRMGGVTEIFTETPEGAVPKFAEITPTPTPMPGNCAWKSLMNMAG